MQSSNLAERLEEYAALDALRLRSAPATRQVMAPCGQAGAVRKAGRRSRRAPGIVIRDQGLRLFQVR